MSNRPAQDPGGGELARSSFSREGACGQAQAARRVRRSRDLACWPAGRRPDRSGRRSRGVIACLIKPARERVFDDSLSWRGGRRPSGELLFASSRLAVMMWDDWLRRVGEEMRVREIGGSGAGWNVGGVAVAIGRVSEPLRSPPSSARAVSAVANRALVERETLHLSMSKALANLSRSICVSRQRSQPRVLCSRCRPACPNRMSRLADLASSPVPRLLGHSPTSSNGRSSFHHLASFASPSSTQLSLNSAEVRSPSLFRFQTSRPSARARLGSSGPRARAVPAVAVVAASPARLASKRGPSQATLSSGTEAGMELFVKL